MGKNKIMNNNINSIYIDISKIYDIKNTIIIDK